MTNKGKRNPPQGFSEELWRDLRHDLAQCVRSMENIGNLLEKNLMPMDKAAAELKKLSKQAGSVYTVMFEEETKE